MTFLTQLCVIIEYNLIDKHKIDAVQRFQAKILREKTEPPWISSEYFWGLEDPKHAICLSESDSQTDKLLMIHKCDEVQTHKREVLNFIGVTVYRLCSFRVRQSIQVTAMARNC